MPHDVKTMHLLFLSRSCRNLNSCIPPKLNHFFPVDLRERSGIIMTKTTWQCRFPACLPALQKRLVYPVWLYVRESRFFIGYLRLSPV